NNVAKALISDWRLSGIQTYTEGTPEGVVGTNCTVPYSSSIVPGNPGCYANYNPNFSGPIKMNGSYGSGPDVLSSTPPVYLNINAFETPAPYTFGNTPRTLAFGLRNTTALNENFSLVRDIKPTEFLTLHIAADAFNAFNRTQFSAPSIAINSANFGQVGAQANAPRTFQFETKIIF
ncbi:MAG TPA: hypothetical protein VEN79_15705, partial [Terriglobia bacterium]|nr:hypothetical protein [Terriglobia bacterium]